MKKKVINLRLKKVPGKVESPEEAERKAKIIKTNVSRTFSHLYQAIYGGKTPKSEGVYWDSVSDNCKVDRLGHHHTEIKASIRRQGSPHCSPVQVSHYALKLQERIDAGDSTPSIDYAFFRYGHWENDSGVTRLDNRGILEIIANRTNNLLVLPFNLAMLLFMGSTVEEKDQTSSNHSRDDVLCWRPSASTLTSLMKRPEDVINILMDKLKQRYAHLGETGKSIYESQRAEAERYLALAEVGSEQYMSPDNLYLGRLKVKPFRVTRFYLADSQPWLKSFANHHKHILKGILHTSDTDEVAERLKVLRENNPW